MSRTKSERDFLLGGASMLPQYCISLYCVLVAAGTMTASLAARVAAVTRHGW
jgi:hypothetical protein